MSSFDDSMIKRIENPKDFTKNKLLDLINKFIKIKGFKVNIQNQLHPHMLAMDN